VLAFADFMGRAKLSKIAALLYLYSGRFFED